MYREAYGLWAANGILFNHESPRRGATFVTRKITRALSAIKKGTQKELILGNLDAKRDWFHAKDAVEAMYLITQQDNPGDYCIGSGKSYSVRQFIEACCAWHQMPLEWKGNDGYSNGVKIIGTDPKYLRPLEVPHLQADCTKALMELGWKPKISFEELVGQMCAGDA
jgi:GDPmannose 4,6-dehydratase